MGDLARGFALQPLIFAAGLHHHRPPGDCIWQALIRRSAQGGCLRNDALAPEVTAAFAAAKGGLVGAVADERAEFRALAQPAATGSKCSTTGKGS